MGGWRCPRDQGPLARISEEYDGVGGPLTRTRWECQTCKMVYALPAGGTPSDLQLLGRTEEEGISLPPLSPWRAALGWVVAVPAFVLGFLVVPAIFAGLILWNTPLAWILIIILGLPGILIWVGAYGIGMTIAGSLYNRIATGSWSGLREDWQSRVRT